MRKVTINPNVPWDGDWISRDGINKPTLAALDASLKTYGLEIVTAHGRHPESDIISDHVFRVAFCPKSGA